MLVCPIQGKVRITQRFGGAYETYKRFGLAGHDGIDMTGEFKGVLVPVHAPAEGVVAEVGNQGTSGYGRFVRIRTRETDAAGRRKEIVLAHLSETCVKRGSWVYLYDRIGTMGNTGFSSGPHLHVGLRFLDAEGMVLDAGNGYLGYVDFLAHLLGIMDAGMFAQNFLFPFG